MGNRATCPICNSYSSDTYADIENGNDCRICEAKNELLSSFQEILERKEIYNKKNICNELLEENEKLNKEVILLKTKISKLIDVLGYEFSSPVLELIKNCLNILHE